MKRTLFTSAVALMLASNAYAQVTTAVKESGKAIAEGTREAGDDIKAAAASEPDKSIDKAKARAHKASKHRHGHRAKEASKAAVD